MGQAQISMGKVGFGLVQPRPSQVRTISSYIVLSRVGPSLIKPCQVGSIQSQFESRQPLVELGWANQVGPRLDQDGLGQVKLSQVATSVKLVRKG